jgi:hypothetical protein
MRSGLLLPKDDLAKYADPASMAALRDVPCIVATSIDIDTTSEAGNILWGATLDAAKAARQAKIPYFVALRGDYPDEHGNLVTESGAYCVYIDRMTGAPAHPYYTLAQLIDEYCGQHTVMIITAPGQNITAYPENVSSLLEATKRAAIVTGGRDYGTLLSLSRSRRLVDAIISQAISDLAGAPFDTISGILALTAEGREVLYKLSEPSMHFTTTIARWARHWKIRNGHVGLRVEQSAALAVLEDADPEFLATYCEQALQLLELVSKLAAPSLSGLSERQRHSYEAAMLALDVLASYEGTHA